MSRRIFFFFNNFIFSNFFHSKLSNPLLSSIQKARRKFDKFLSEKSRKNEDLDVLEKRKKNIRNENRRIAQDLIFLVDS